MKKITNKLFFILTILVAGLLVTGCANDDDEITEAYITRIDENYKDIPDTMSISSFSVTMTYPVSEIVGMKFVYPYKDPKGKPVMLSGMICVPRILYESDDKKAQGIMLYNHYTIMTDEESPSFGYVKGKGAIGVKEISALGLKATIMGSEGYVGLKNHKIITVAADYYGFGQTKDYVQYYCEGDYNARASLEALKAAKEILKGMGYTWGDYLLNTGYSQGGQTAIPVQKLVDTGEYNEKISATFAGSGPYDLTATYESYLSVKDQERDISVVIYPVLSYNEHKSLGIKYSEIFKEGLAGLINDWFLSKQYTREEIDKKLKDEGMPKLQDAFADVLLDKDSEVSKKLTGALDTVNLTKGWTPNKNDRIYLYYSEADTLVPKVNSEELTEFLKISGFEINEMPASLLKMLVYILDPYGDGQTGKGDPNARPAPGKIIVRKSAEADGTTHENGGAFWLMDILSELKQEFIAEKATE